MSRDEVEAMLLGAPAIGSMVEVLAHRHRPADFVSGIGFVVEPVWMAASVVELAAGGFVALVYYPKGESMHQLLLFAQEGREWRRPAAAAKP